MAGSNDGYVPGNDKLPNDTNADIGDSSRQEEGLASVDGDYEVEKVERAYRYEPLFPA
jgi:hypothetical protein